LYDVSASKTVVLLVEWFLLFFAPMGAKNNKKPLCHFARMRAKWQKHGVRDRYALGDNP